MLTCITGGMYLQNLAPFPPQGIRGLQGIWAADTVLKEIGAIGILIGGLARALWRGATNPATLAEHKDVDVLITSPDCRLHPQQWQDGIDWWVFHHPDEKPTNGSEYGLTWSLTVTNPTQWDPGLYLCPRKVLIATLQHEKTQSTWATDPSPSFYNQVRLSILPVLPPESIRPTWVTDESPLATYCLVA